MRVPYCVGVRAAAEILVLVAPDTDLGKQKEDQLRTQLRRPIPP